jgi:hypothetical protein
MPPPLSLPRTPPPLPSLPYARMIYPPRCPCQSRTPPPHPSASPANGQLSVSKIPQKYRDGYPKRPTPPFAAAKLTLAGAGHCGMMLPC